MTSFARAKQPSRIRALAILVHRWVGLAIAVFLIVAGLTGSLMAFYPELDAALNPELFSVTPPTPGAPLLDPIELRDRIRAQFPKDTAVDAVLLSLQRDRSVNYWIADRETFVDPYSARILGTRKFGSLLEGKKSILTFFYELHFTLGLSEVGATLFGVAATLWTIDCFVGAYLTLPPRSARKQEKAWLARWWPAWLLKTNSLFTGVFTFHRASGLWLWSLLLVFAWSAVALNFGEEVYEPVMNTVLPREPIPELPELDPPRTQPKLDARTALARGRSLMTEQSSKAGFTIHSERALFYEADHGVYGYGVDSSLDIDERLSDTVVYFDADSGAFVRLSAPGQDARSTLDRWLIGLHFGRIRAFGLAYRAFVCLFGLVVTALTATGLWIWLRKRKKRSRPA